MRTELEPSRPRVRDVRAIATLLVLTLPCASLGCSEKSPVEKPVPPDMSGLVRSYDAPTLALELGNLQTALDVSVKLGVTVDRAVSLVPEVEAAVQVGLNSNGESDQIGSSGEGESKPLAVTGSGFLRIRRICPGWQPGAGADEANGAIDLTVGFTEAGIDPVVWGGFTSCKFPLDGQPVTVQGGLNLHVGENLAFDRFGTSPIIVALSGELVTDSATEQLSVDFRILPSGAFEYRVFVGDQHLIYWDSLAERGFRAANGTWVCEFDKHQCAKKEDGQQLAW